MASKYNKGANQERAIINFLKRHNFVCMRGAGSKSSTNADIIAIRFPYVYLIQCKANELTPTMSAKLVLDITKAVREDYYYVRALALSSEWEEEVKPYL